MGRHKSDVAIVGGGPAGSTTACLLKKYLPEMRVSIFERETFPRDHIGESQLPAITPILAEMGVWDKVEAGGFPIKLGGTYRWGATDELWYLNFIPPEAFVPKPRPARYEGQRLRTAFQVDRSRFDKILLDHAASMGCKVFEKTPVTHVGVEGDNITGLTAVGEDGEEFEISARYYVDASGEGGLLRKALKIPTDIPTTLRNIAFWDYWQDAEWAETVGGEATRIQVMSLGWGWMWFIPITSTRTSIGLVLPVSYYKESGKRPLDLYLEAVKQEPLIAELTRNAVREERFEATKDWNYLTDRLAGENWFLVGDSCGFADPILSAGMTLAHTSGQKVAYSILELQRKRHSPEWIKNQYSSSHRTQIHRHMRFAEFWYAGNGRFTDLKSYCSEIASSAGLNLDPDDAFFWLGAGGFARDNTLGFANAATFPMSGVKTMTSRISGGEAPFVLEGVNQLRLNTEGTQVGEPYAHYDEGQIHEIPCMERGDAKLPLAGLFRMLLHHLPNESDPDRLIKLCQLEAERDWIFPNGSSPGPSLFVDALEGLVIDGWVIAERNPSKPPSKLLRRRATAGSR